ncbi:UNVERIFIED_CONTAM: hypothetical protein RMT77_018030 [Armadillidium vulgare]
MFIFILFVLSTSKCFFVVADDLQFTEKEILKLRNGVKSMFYHAYEGYMKFAIPFDELRPLTCDGHDTWGSYSLTLIDALDTLAVMENYTEFQRVYNLIAERKTFEADINVSVFETNIRIVGGLLSGHLLARRMGVPVGEGWPCSGPLLGLAVDAATRLLPAFDTPTGMPYGTVNLKYGVPEGETPVTCAAGVGTFIIEFGTLSRLTGDPLFEEVALRAMHSLWQRRSRLDLIGNHIDVLTGHWTGSDAGIGAGVDSFFEYLVKGSFLFQRPELMAIFHDARSAIDKHLRHEDWYLWKSMQRAQVSMAVFQSLEAFWPGVLTLAGDIESAQKTLFNYHQVMKQYGFTPEFYSIPQATAFSKRSGYPLRPEFIESLMYLYQGTKDHAFLKMGADLVRAIEHSTKTKCGYATVENVVDHSLDNRMESFFLAETTKYLYLLFHENHWIHSSGNRGKPLSVNKRHCVIDSGGYFFNTEAHPIDAGALACCSGPEEDDFALSEEELINLIVDPTSFSEIRQTSIPLKMTSKMTSSDKILPVNEDEDSLRSVDEVKNLSSQPVDVDVLVTKDDLDTNTSNGFVVSGHSGLVEDVSVKKETFLYNDLLNTSDTAKLTAERETLVIKDTNHVNENDMITPSHTSSDPITIEKDKNTSEYEGSVSDVLETKNNEEKLPWNPHFSSLKQVNNEEGGKEVGVGEISEVTPSVSSSKFPRDSESRIIEKNFNTEVKPKNREFSLEKLRWAVQEDLLAVENQTDNFSPSLLTCKISFSENFNYKGQMILSP